MPKGFIDSILQKIKYGYEYSLRKRLYELFNANNEFLKNFINKSGVLIDEIVNTRNYYTHYDSKNSSVKEDLDLDYLCEKIKIIMFILILFELEYSNNEIEEIILFQETIHAIINVSGINTIRKNIEDITQTDDLKMV